MTMTTVQKIASGSVLRGFSTSSPAVETVSMPMYEKNTIDAASPTPLTPNGASEA